MNDTVEFSRRKALTLALFGGVGATAASIGTLEAAVAEPAARPGPPQNSWGRGIEGQRKADLGNGFFQNPVLAGDHPDPTVLKDDEDYYLTCTSFEAHPGLLIWHSRDLVNWQPLAPALTKPLGSVFAVDLCRHQGRYYIYIPVFPTAVSEGMNGRPRIFVIYADDIRGPWSDPVALDIFGFIDPGHIVGEDGKRYLFLSGVSRVRLTDDGLSTDGPIEHVYDGWKYPDDWVVEAYALEGPKLLRRNGWYYLISAVGGTAGPPTGHMVIAARSRSIHGPWEDCPHNPIVRTRDVSEGWWSRGHATLVQGQRADWWMLYHGYENGYRTLGRQTLLEPIEWTAHDWPRALGGDLSRPIRKPAAGDSQPHGYALSDDFASNRIGLQWSFYDPSAHESARARYAGGALVIAGKGDSPANGSPLTCLVGDLAYEISVQMELSGAAQGGLLLFYNSQLYCGMGHNGSTMTTYRGGRASFWSEPAPAARRIYLKIVNDRHIVTMYYSPDGVKWTRHGLRLETSGYHTNTVADSLLSLRPALWASGVGEVRFRTFQYRSLM